MVLSIATLRTFDDGLRDHMYLLVVCIEITDPVRRTAGVEDVPGVLPPIEYSQ
jgi:hypothetical protein